MVEAIGQTGDFDPAISRRLVEDELLVDLTPWVSPLEHGHKGLSSLITIVVILFRFLHVIFHCLLMLADIFDLLSLFLAGEDRFPVSGVGDLGQLMWASLLASAVLLGLEFDIRILNLLLILSLLSKTGKHFKKLQK